MTKAGIAMMGQMKKIVVGNLLFLLLYKKLGSALGTKGFLISR